MFSRVLIANRGAIATRIIRSLRRLGIESVAVYAESDRDSLHVQQADRAFSLGEGPAADTYLAVDKILAIAQATDAQAIHPGYGFLSENADFAQACEAQGFVFLGPRPEQIIEFGLKHRARALALAADVPLLPGTDLLTNLDDARVEAERIGYPVMLKSTAGGGGIGMQVCQSQVELEQAYASVRRLGQNNFSNDGVFIEKFIACARHIEVQVIGDGQGRALAIGERDCSAQRRNQKVIEECPAPNLSDDVRANLHSTAANLLASVSYRNAGTVEFIFDADTEQFYFLEVNTRLQVEHGVTEEVFKVDLVEWMLKVGAGEHAFFDSFDAKPQGHAVQVRVYAEDPYKDFAPAPGLLTAVEWTDEPNVRIDHWVSAGLEISPYFDPMIAKVIVHRPSRTEALEAMASALRQSHLYGTQTNLQYLEMLMQDAVVTAGTITTRYLNDVQWQPRRLDVISGGTQTTIQDARGRRGYWHVGVPPSGAFDNYTFRLLNRVLGNDIDAAGFEVAVQGPSFKVSCDTTIAWGGATTEFTCNGELIPPYEVFEVEAGSVLEMGALASTGARAYIAFGGGLNCPEYLGSRSTFTLGQFGGHNGRALRAGDVLALPPNNPNCAHQTAPVELRPVLSSAWTLRVIYGPHGAPDFLTESDIDTFFDATWEVHYNSSRTGVRLIGPKPEWARTDGGEAGLHPSNLHDNAYAFGSIDFTGDMPVILGPDGPSLGGFVCPATVITADLWKLGQLRAGDRVRFEPVSIEAAVAIEAAQHRALSELEPRPVRLPNYTRPLSPVINRLPAAEFGDEIVFRPAGDHFLLIEYGDLELDIRLRFRAHALMRYLQETKVEGLRELTPGIRSLQIHYDSQTISLQSVIDTVVAAERVLASQLDSLEVPSRVVHLPLSWNDEACQQAIDKYMQSVRANAPWCPSNLEFIRRINGLKDIEAVKSVVFDASYLVLGLGDVYLGAPVATPVDPRHRLVTTKYNPARTWTAENSVGIGGSYLCVYGMEGPGGYQFVGRTLQMWNRYQQTAQFQQPWLLRFFDQIRFYEVGHDELMQMRRDFPTGQHAIRIEETRFSLADYQAFVDSQEESIQAFKLQREQAFADELARWHRDGQFHFEVEEAPELTQSENWPQGAILVDSPVSGSVWQHSIAEGDTVVPGQTLMVLESMKMEIPVVATRAGRVYRLPLGAGARITAGQTLCVLKETSNEA